MVRLILEIDVNPERIIIAGLCHFIAFFVDIVHFPSPLQDRK